MNYQRSIARSVNSTNLIKKGARIMTGVDEVILRNIEATIDLAEIVTSTYGPNGLNKIIINKHGSASITNDSYTILTELDVVHPAANVLLESSIMQEREVGDGTNFIIVFGGELLRHAGKLIRTGLKPIEVVSGYIKARDKLLELMEGDDLCVKEIKEVATADPEELVAAIKSSISSKQSGYEDVLSDLVVKASLHVLPKNQKNFIVDNVRTVKLVGGTVFDSRVIKGMVVKKRFLSEKDEFTNSKICVYLAGIESAQTETKGTVRITNKDEFFNYTKSEEDLIKEKIKTLKDMGVSILATNQNISDIAENYIRNMGMAVIKIPSKFDILRLCRVVGATPLSTFRMPSESEIGFLSKLRMEEIGSEVVTIFEQSEKTKSKLATILLRGATKDIVDDVERAVNDGINSFRVLCNDGRLVYGGGAFEIEASKLLREFGESFSGIEQYAILEFAESLEALPRAISDNSGMKSVEVLTELMARHLDGKKDCGIDVVEEDVGSMEKLEIYDLYQTKWWGIQLCLNAVLTILKVDQIIMKKPAETNIAPPKLAPRDID